MNRVCVVGAGASGMMAAMYAARNGAYVTLFEVNDETGKKILRTGNGKCNFSNTNMSSEYYNTDSPEFVKKALERFGFDDLMLCFSRLGLLIREKGGYLYPYCEQARAVRDVCEAELRSLCVKIRTNSYVNCIARDEKGGFLISVEGQKEREHFDKVILACGGKAGLLKKDRQNGYDLLKALGVTSTELEPGLTKLVCSEGFLKALNGIRCEANVSLIYDNENIGSESGEVLFRENGVSGICIFNLSSYCMNKDIAAGRIKLSLDLLPGFDEGSLTDFLNMRFLVNSDKTVFDFCKGLFADALNDLMIKQSDLDPNAEISKVGRERILEAILKMKDVTLSVTGKAGFESAQVTLGGVNTSDLTEFMEAKKIPGLFVVGELVNTDGPCGGYNLQWAFTSGAIAGEHACY